MTSFPNAGRGIILNAAGEPAGQPSARILQFARRDEGRALNYRMEAKGDAADVYIYDSIGMWGITAQQFAKDLKALGTLKTINLRINSDGGDVFDGRAIFTTLAQNPARIVVHIDGLAASIASLIAMAGNEIRIADGAFVMIHNAWGISVGNSAEMRRMADLLDSVDATIQDTYAVRTKNSVADIRKWMDAETWMPAKEAVDRGFADVLDEPVQMAAAVSAVHDPARFKNMPAALVPRPKRDLAVARLAALKRT